MSDGYAILMSDLLAMARTFATEGEALSSVVSGANVTVCDTGGPASNAALQVALETAGMATGQLSGVVATHGKELSASYQEYRDAEESSTQICQDLTRLITEK